MTLVSVWASTFACGAWNAAARGPTRATTGLAPPPPRPRALLVHVLGGSFPTVIVCTMIPLKVMTTSVPGAYPHTVTRTVWPGTATVRSRTMIGLGRPCWVVVVGQLLNGYGHAVVVVLPRPWPWLP